MEQVENNNRLFYYYIGNEKHGAVSAEELRQLVLDGIINLNTQIETSDGKNLQAKSIKNLFDVQVLIKRVDNLSDRIATLEQKIELLISTGTHKSSSKKAPKTSISEEECPNDEISESSSSSDTSEDSEIQKTKTLRIGKWYVGTHIAPGRYKVLTVSDTCSINQKDDNENFIFGVYLIKEDKHQRSCEIELEEKDMLDINGVAKFAYLSEVIQKRKRD